MKIILGTESFSPNVSGVAVATEILANNLVKAGHEVFVFTPGNVFKTKIDKKFTKYRVLRLKSIPNIFRKGFRITAPQTRALEKEVDKIKPDLIHLQDVATIGLMLRNIGNNRAIPVIITNHFSLEFALSYIKLPWLKPVAKEALIKYLANFYDQCDCVVTPTETIARQVRSWGTETPVIAISNGIDFDRFASNFPKIFLQDFKKKCQIPDNPVVLYVGRIDKDKSIEVLVKAIPLILKSVDAHFVIAGTGDLVDEMQDLAEQLKVRNYITFLGRLDKNSNEFIALYKCGAVFAIPSTIETQSLVTLEAMSAGLPVVGANANALPELIKPGFNGYLFTPGNSKLLAKYIIKVLKSKKSIAKMGEHSQEIASNHEISKTFDLMLELYDSILDNKSSDGKNWS